MSKWVCHCDHLCNSPMANNGAFSFGCNKTVVASSTNAMTCWTTKKTSAHNGKNKTANHFCTDLIVKRCCTLTEFEQKVMELCQTQNFCLSTFCCLLSTAWHFVWFQCFLCLFQVLLCLSKRLCQQLDECAVWMCKMHVKWANAETLQDLLFLFNNFCISATLPGCYSVLNTDWHGFSSHFEKAHICQFELGCHCIEELAFLHWLKPRFSNWLMIHAFKCAWLMPIQKFWDQLCAKMSLAQLQMWTQMTKQNVGFFQLGAKLQFSDSQLSQTFVQLAVFGSWLSFWIFNQCL